MVFILLFDVTSAASGWSAVWSFLFFELPVARRTTPVIGFLQGGRPLVFFHQTMAFPAAQFFTLHINKPSALFILQVMAGAAAFIFKCAGMTFVGKHDRWSSELAENVLVCQDIYIFLGK